MIWCHLKTVFDLQISNVPKSVFPFDLAGEFRSGRYDGINTGKRSSPNSLSFSHPAQNTFASCKYASSSSALGLLLLNFAELSLDGSFAFQQFFDRVVVEYLLRLIHIVYKFVCVVATLLWAESVQDSCRQEGCTHLSIDAHFGQVL